MEVARKGDYAQVQELLRKVGSGKAFGTNAHMITAAEAKERFPLLEEDTIECAMWDPDAGLVTPRSQKVAGDLVDGPWRRASYRPLPIPPLKKSLLKTAAQSV